MKSHKSNLHYTNSTAHVMGHLQVSCNILFVACKEASVGMTYQNKLHLLIQSVIPLLQTSTDSDFGVLCSVRHIS